MPEDDKPFQPEQPEYGLSKLLRETFEIRSGGLADILHELLTAARMYLGMEVAFVSEFQGSKRVFRYVDQTGDTEMLKVGCDDPIEESYCKHVVEGNLPELIHNAQEMSEAQPLPATHELGIGAHVSVPIHLSDGSIYGTFCAFSFWSDESLGERDMALMRVFSDIAGRLIEQNVHERQEKERRRDRIDTLLQDDGYRAVWQPIVEIETGRIIGLESLTRFPDDLGLSVEECFIEARAVGLGRELEGRTLERGLALLPHLPEPVYLTCNMSAESLLSGWVDDMLGQAPP